VILEQKIEDLAKYSDASYEFLGSEDFELGAESHLFCKVSCVGGEKPVRSRFERRDEYRDICLVSNQVAMTIDLLFGWKRNDLRLKES
jgi:hypothetical protein